MTTSNANAIGPNDIIGRGLVGFPGSVITAIWPIVDELEEWQSGSPIYLLKIELADGRNVKLPKPWRGIVRDTYDRNEGSSQ